jgi:hypothetical protein
MANPRTWQLLAAMEAGLGRIQTANGFHSDAGLHVTREPAQIPDTDAGLIALVLEGLQRATDSGVGRHGRLATVVVIGKVPITQDNAQARAHELLEDIEGCFETQRGAFGVGLEWPKFLEGKPLPPVDGVQWVGVEARFTAHVRIR